jgi:NAD(P)-dependent dehydrogenase (short-subunit alcohol dehydrogenase family)
MSSNTAHHFVVPRHSLYSGSKGAIESFVPVLAKDCGNKKITVNAVAPGGTVTDMFHAVAKHYIPNSDDMTPEQLEQVGILLLAAALYIYTYIEFQITDTIEVRGIRLATCSLRPASRCCACRVFPC